LVELLVVIVTAISVLIPKLYTMIFYRISFLRIAFLLFYTVIFILGYNVIAVTEVYSQFEKLEILPRSEFLNYSRLKFWQPSAAFSSKDQFLRYNANEFRSQFYIVEQNNNSCPTNILNQYSNSRLSNFEFYNHSINYFSNDHFYESKPFYKMLRMTRSDFTNFYLSRENLFCFGAGLMFHAVISNTSADQNLRNWYQDEVRSTGTDNLSSIAKFLGEGRYSIPFFGITAGVYCLSQKFCEPCQFLGVAGDYSTRVLRSYAVGAPTLLLFQSMLGCSRPGENSYNSSWRFFRDDNSLSGHTFIGAVPFLVAASMTNRFWLRFILFVGSTFAGLSRINDDAHYFSQVAIGWSVAYLSVRAVAQTNKTFDQNNSNIKIFPILESKYIGLGFIFRR
jgi:membrane-associated phospholipid phosphatase